ncbi:MAG TPA: hypothetical protein PLR25_21115, partial [Planctomycetaceae bacterium]|nr:hypothetical protein [Planctomycetaceae bacterium]
MAAYASAFENPMESDYFSTAAAGPPGNTWNGIDLIATPVETSPPLPAMINADTETAPSNAVPDSTALAMPEFDYSTAMPAETNMAAYASAFENPMESDYFSTAAAGPLGDTWDGFDLIATPVETSPPLPAMINADTELTTVNAMPDSSALAIPEFDYSTAMPAENNVAAYAPAFAPPMESDFFSIAAAGPPGDGVTGQDPMIDEQDTSNAQQQQVEQPIGESASPQQTSPQNNVPDDPRLNWHPMQLPGGVEFHDSDFVGYSLQDDPFSVTPDGLQSFEIVQTNETVFDTQATDSELDEGELQPHVTSTMTTKQDYINANEWTVTYSLTNRYDDDEESNDSDTIKTDVNRGYETNLVITVTNGTTVTTTYTVSDSFRFGSGAIPGEDDSDDPWAIPESWLDDAERSVNQNTDSADSGSADQQDSSSFGMNSGTTSAAPAAATASQTMNDTNNDSSDETANTNGSGFFFAGGYSSSITTTTDKVTLENGTPATRKTNSFSWSSFFSLRIGASYDSSQAGSTTTDSVTSTDTISTNTIENQTPDGDSIVASELPQIETSTNNTTSDPASGFKPVATGSYRAFATGSMAASLSYTTTIPDNPLNLLSSTFSASAAFAVSALTGYSLDSTVKGDLDQSSGNENANTDEHLKIHVDNSNVSSASSGFSFWFGASIGNDPSSPNSETVDASTTNTDADPVSSAEIPPSLPAPDNIDDSNAESIGSMPGRQPAADLIKGKPSGTQLTISTVSSSKVIEDVSFSEKTRSSHGYILNSDNDKKQTTSDDHFTVALGTEETNLEFGNSKSSSTDVKLISDQYSHNDAPGNPYHTAQFTDKYSEETSYSDDFQFSLNAEKPVTNSVFLKEHFDASSRDYRSGDLGTAIVLKTELYFNTT